MLKEFFRPFEMVSNVFQLTCILKGHAMFLFKTHFSFHICSIVFHRSASLEVLCTMHSCHLFSALKLSNEQKKCARPMKQNAEWRKIRLPAKFMSRDLNRNRTKQKKNEKKAYRWKQICSLHCTCSFSRTIGWNGNVSEQNCWCWSTLESTPYKIPCKEKYHSI